jgi:competence protein ComEA
MSEMVRPAPPRTVGDRVRARCASLTWSRLGVGAGSVCLVAATSWWLLAAPPAPVERSLPRATTAGSSSTAVTTVVNAASAVTPAGPAPAGPLVVHVAGAVARPGVVRVAAGARIVDALDAAGGPTADADVSAVNLAARLSDGQRVLVPVLGGPVGEGAASAAGAVPLSPDAPIDLNQATATELEELPGVGPSTAAAIVAHRQRIGRFLRIEDLLEVRGIGTARLEALRPLVRV